MPSGAEVFDSCHDGATEGCSSSGGLAECWENTHQQSSKWRNCSFQGKYNQNPFDHLKMWITVNLFEPCSLFWFPVNYLHVQLSGSFSKVGVDHVWPDRCQGAAPSDLRLHLQLRQWWESGICAHDLHLVVRFSSYLHKSQLIVVDGCTLLPEIRPTYHCLITHRLLHDYSIDGLIEAILLFFSVLSFVTCCTFWPERKMVRDPI